MGIRIKRVLGFGIDDLESEFDSRINKSGYLASLAREPTSSDDKRWTADKYRDYIGIGHTRILEGKLDESDPIQDIVYLGSTESSVWSPHRSITWDREYGSRNILVITPAFLSKSWTRYDDVIDYYTEVGRVANNTPLSWNIVDLSAHGLWPFTHALWDTLTKVKIHPTSANFSKKLLEDVNIRWYPPNELISLCKFLRLFSDDDVIYSLKPVLYTYWT